MRIAPGRHLGRQAHIVILQHVPGCGVDFHNGVVIQVFDAACTVEKGFIRRYSLTESNPFRVGIDLLAQENQFSRFDGRLRRHRAGNRKQKRKNQAEGLSEKRKKCRPVFSSCLPLTGPVMLPERDGIRHPLPVQRGTPSSSGQISISLPICGMIKRISGWFFSIVFRSRLTLTVLVTGGKALSK